MTGAELAMGGWFASAVIRRFVNKAGDYLSNNHGLHKETKEMLNNLKNTLPGMQAILEEAEKRQVENKGLSEWLKLLKDAAYEAEDVLDDFEAKSIREDLKGKSKVSKAASSVAQSAKNLILLDDDVRKLKALVNKLEELCKQSSTFVVLLHSDSDHKGKGLASTDCGETTPIFPHDQILLGRDNEIKLIVSMILGYEIELSERETSSQDDKSAAGPSSAKGAEAKSILKEGIGEGSKSSQKTSGHYGRPHIIPIVGICGVGKTALAQIIYNHQLLESHFDLKRWFYMSQKSDVNKIVQAFVPSFDSSDPSDLTKKLIRKIEGKRFLLVLDDVCSEVCSKLEDILPWFNAGAYGSVILVTTRERNVSCILGTIDPIILNPLEWSYFLQLLEYYAFKNANITREKGQAIKQICWNIGNKLYGIPLAAKIVGNMLRSNMDVEHWEHILQDLRYRTKKFSFLEIAYQHLDAKLKECFAFCSTFPTNYIIERDRIIQLWIANNFIQLNSRDERRSEDTGKMLFNKLVNMSFFLPTPWPHKYIMNRAIRELGGAVFSNEVFIFDDNPNTNPCLYGCSFQKENPSPCSHGYSVIENSQRTIPPSTRYLTVRTKEPIIDLKACSDKLRTLLVHSDYYKSPVTAQKKGWIGPLNRMKKDYCKQISSDSFLSSTGKLRVLELSYPDVRVKKYTDAICQLSHLRFLDLSFSGIRELPESICTLCHLQVLDIRGCEFRKVPKNMNHLINLRHLYANKKTIFLISGIGKLTKLQELKEFKIAEEEGYTISELAEMNEIGGHLSIVGLVNVKNEVDALGAKLEEKTHLKALSLKWDACSPNGSSRDNMEKANKILNSLKPHHGLEKWEIENYPGTQLPSWTTLTLINIRCIYLSGCCYVETIPPLGQLSYLETLVLSGLPFQRFGEELYGLGEVIFPVLKVLKFVGMKNWEVWSPAKEGELLPCLEELEIQDCDDLRATPLRSLKLSCLKKLELSRCRGVLLEGSICDKQLPMLTSLCISDNPPITLLYHNLPDLRVLSLQHSDLEFEGDQPCLSNLKSLILDNCCVRWNKKPVLPSLAKLEMNSYLDDIMGMNVTHSSLSSLKILKLKGDLFKIPDTQQAEFKCLERPIYLRQEELQLGSTPKNIPNWSMSRGLATGKYGRDLGKLNQELSKWFGKVPHLVELTLDIRDLPEFPSTLANLVSLKSLTLGGRSLDTDSKIISASHRIENTDSRIQSLPGMPPNLKELYINDASYVLQQRCCPNKGQDWHKIAHIPYIRVNGSTLQML